MIIHYKTNIRSDLKYKKYEIKTKKKCRKT